MTHTPATHASIQDLQSLASQTYVAMTTFRKTGKPVTTPMHLANAENRVFFRTFSDSGKARRLRHTSHIRLVPSDIRGTPHGTAIEAVASRLDGQDEALAIRAMSGKYPLVHRLIPLWHRLRGWRTYHYEVLPETANSNDAGQRT